MKANIMTDITVPTLGESVTEATVGQWLKAQGDTVSRDEVLVELETDKVSVEVSATEDGVLSEIVAKEGDTVEIGAGGWSFIRDEIEWCARQAGVRAPRPKYAGRPPSAATATGLLSKHKAEQAALVDTALSKQQVQDSIVTS